MKTEEKSGTERRQNGSKTGAGARGAEGVVVAPPDLRMSVYGIQGELGVIPRDGVNPHFRNRYTTLTKMWEAVKPVLLKWGVIVTNSLEVTDGRLMLVTRVVHVQSGEEKSSSFPISLELPPQAMGSAITYGRRYNLGALLQIVTDDEDDDGEEATKRTPPVVDI